MEKIKLWWFDNEGTMNTNTFDNDQEANEFLENHGLEEFKRIEILE